MYKETEVNESNTELNTQLVRFSFDICSRTDDGILISPLLCNSNEKHLLAKNFHLAKKVLSSTLKKLESDVAKLEMADNNVKDLEALGIIERVHDLETFMTKTQPAVF